ncbi:ABC transporter ATP-binding protein [Methanoregula sp. PtaB.Bin085]|uniref:ABC transporter ATP-binding protein n=1 Tax=Methanoregula sp. PtaB.Bin085 TaxID=1811680 RepID=UPI0009C63527|nr:ABC transporter ATP-binding protein [Methanoregula sp. PtaB.Bin085]OPX62332.1 MAG: Trehalose/maltose import ATP-binding protein MalK [Methanoregula sp. PtaB.Bin085]
MIRIESLTKNFGSAETIKETSLEIQAGEIFTFIGPSGSGKTTLLRLIDLLDRPTTGTVYFNGQDTGGNENERLAFRRRMAMVFQKPAVLNTTVAENVSFGLKFRGVPEEETQKRVIAALGLVGLSEFAGRRAVTLSGGEMQRVALARAIVTEPEVLLLDEPTANLDPVSSDLIENLIRGINRKSGTTIIMSTHDMIQGQRLADRIGVLMNGRLVQVGTAEEIFYQPAGREIARFVGIDAITGGIVTENRGGHALIRVKDLCFEALTGLPAGQQVILYIRPEEVTVSPAGSSSSRTSVRNQLAGRITKMVPSGPFIRITIDCGIPITALITRRSCTELGLSAGIMVVAGVKATAVHVFPFEG